MTERPAILSAKLDKLAAIIADGNTGKKSPPGNATADEVRAAQSAAVQEVNATSESVRAVEAIALPSERVQS